MSDYSKSEDFRQYANYLHSHQCVLRFTIFPNKICIRRYDLGKNSTLIDLETRMKQDPFVTEDIVQSEITVNDHALDCVGRKEVMRVRETFQKPV